MIFCNFKQVNYEPQIKFNTRARQERKETTKITVAGVAEKKQSRRTAAI